MRIGQDQSLQHIDRCLLKFGNGDQPLADLPDSIQISPENLYEIQDYSGIAIRESPRHFVEKIFPDINTNLHVESLWISVDQINAIISHELLHEKVTFYPVLTVQVIQEIPLDFSWNSRKISLLQESLHITST